MLGDQTIGISCRRFAKLLPLLVGQAGRRHDERNFSLQADGRDRFRRHRHGKVDHRLRVSVAKVSASGNAELIDARQNASVLAQIGMRRRIDRGHDLQLRIDSGQRDQAAAHPPGGSVNRNGNRWHNCFNAANLRTT